jgi:hypothetical protein
MNSSLKKVLSWTFRWLDRFGVHLIPAHYYSPVARRRDLETSNTWRSRPRLPGVQWDLTAQVDWFDETCSEWAAAAEGRVPELMGGPGPGYGPIEGRFLYCFVRNHRPRRVLEIGSGVSTQIMLAGAHDQSIEVQVRCIDPFSPLDDGPSLEIVRAGAQAVATEQLVDYLRAGDLLFIDSTHAVKTGSEVARLYLDIIPALPPGVFIHVHDIYLPFLYDSKVLQWPWDWQETTLLAALLTNNDRLKVLCSQAALHHDRPDVIRQHFASYEPAATVDGLRVGGGGHFPTSIWLQTR